MEIPDLAALRDGDKDAWEAAFRWLWPTSLAVAKEKLGWARPQDVEDVAIDAMEMLVEKVHSVKSVSELKPLLSTISCRRAISRLRWHYGPGGGSQTHSINDTESGANNQIEEMSSDSPTDELEQKELGDLLRGLQSELKPQVREILNDFFMTGLSYIEIAEKRGVAVGSVGVYLKRGLDRLRQLMEKRPTLLKETRDLLRLGIWIITTLTLR